MPESRSPIVGAPDGPCSTPAPVTPDDLGPTAPCDHCGEPAGWSPSVRGFVHVATGTGTCPEASDAWPAPSGHGNDEPTPPAALVDPIVLHSRTRIREFAGTLLAELGVDDAYEDDEERVFALLVQTAELYVDLLTDSGSLSIRSGIESALLGLAENLDVVFAEELTR